MALCTIFHWKSNPSPHLSKEVCSVTAQSPPGKNLCQKTKSTSTPMVWGVPHPSTPMPQRLKVSKLWWTLQRQQEVILLKPLHCPTKGETARAPSQTFIPLVRNSAILNKASTLFISRPSTTAAAVPVAVILSALPLMTSTLFGWEGAWPSHGAMTSSAVSTSSTCEEHKHLPPQRLNLF